ncbi:MAG: efflux RND transporter periplasmic adaptor subunit [Deltaproteobacteria bacterium]|jgi:macrolide-specific efflux system membrane fusion protein|nr:efflux RND transporter periplasmic adaptor subunit [Deltaproteobacteria bacterium]
MTATRKALKPAIIFLALALVAWITLRGCGGQEEVSYLTEPVRRGDIVKTVAATGEVSAVQLVSVGAQVSGQIRLLAVALGQEVKSGDLIAEIESTTQRNDLEINKAKLRTYEAQLAARELSLKVAESQFAREKKLSAGHASSDESLENAENALASARAGLDEIRSLITQARVSVGTAETNLGYTRIVAPLDGTVVSVQVEEGQTVNANQSAPTIVQVADLRRMEVRMQISEGDITKVRPGLPIRYTILSEPSRVFDGVLDSVDPGPAALSDGSYQGTTDSSTAVFYYGKLLAPNDDGVLRIGMTTQNTITIAEAREVLIVPSIAVARRRGRSLVQVMDNGQPVEREVTTGLSDDMSVEVLGGLGEGELVVTAQMSATELAEASTVRSRGGNAQRGGLIGGPQGGGRPQGARPGGR